MSKNQQEHESRVQLEQVTQDSEIIPLLGKTLANGNATRDNAAIKNNCAAFDKRNRPPSVPLNRAQGLVNVDEIARILNVPKTWVYERTRQGQAAIPFIRLGAYVRFEPEEVVNFFKSKEN